MKQSIQPFASSPTHRWQTPLHRLSTSPSIQRRILVPLIILMLLSLLGSTIGFTLSTTASKNRILDAQLASDARRLSDAWSRREQEVSESARLLANDAALITALRGEGEEALLTLDKRILAVRDRFSLDQILLVGADGQVPVNLTTQSALSRIDTHLLIEQLSHSSQAVSLIQLEQSWLLIARSSILPDPQSKHALGTIYTVLDVASETIKMRRNLELNADIELSAGGPIVATLGRTNDVLVSNQGELQVGDLRYRAYISSLSLGNRPIRLALLGSEQTINAILNSGFQVMLISSLLTLVLLCSVGVLIARNFAQPIRELANVANAVAGGDLSQRARIERRDEIGQLGRAFNHATNTISILLDSKMQSVSELDAILQSIADGVLAIDMQAQIVQVNLTAARMLGLAPEDLIHKPLEQLPQLVDPQLKEGCQTLVRLLQNELADSEHSTNQERIHLGECIIRLSSSPIIGSSASRRGAVLVLQNITRDVAAEQAKSEFIAIASHELRTPLAAIKGHADLLAILDHSNLREEQHTSLVAIQRQSKALNLLVNDLLEMARIEQGHNSEAEQWVDPNQVSNQLIELFGVQAIQRHIKLVCRVQDNLPKIWMQDSHLRRILTNLLSNAMKYTHDGGRILFRAYLSNSDTLLEEVHTLPKQLMPNQPIVVFLVKDSGVGIREADQKQLFTRFFRSHNSRTIEAGGTGLGLSITQALVERYQGEIGFQSQEGKGSCFWICLPLQTGSEVEKIHDTQALV